MSEVRHTAAEHSIITTYRKPIWRNFISAIKTYQLISAGDRIAVCMSGGKDSLLLLRALKHLQGYYPLHFDLVGLTIDLGFPGMDYAPIAEMCRELDIPYTVISTDIKEVVFDVRQEDNACARCSATVRCPLSFAT